MHTAPDLSFNVGLERTLIKDMPSLSYLPIMGFL